MWNDCGVVGDIRSPVLAAATAVVLIATTGCGGDDGTRAAKKRGPVSFEAIFKKGATPSVCGGTFERAPVTAAGRKAGVKAIAVARCKAGKDIQGLALVEAKSAADAKDAAIGAAYTFAGKDAGQAAGSGTVACVTDESESPRMICSQPLGSLVMVAVSPEGNRSIGSPAETVGLPEFSRWLESQR